MHDHCLLSSLLGCAFKTTSVLSKNLLLQNGVGIFRCQQGQLEVGVYMGERVLSAGQRPRQSVLQRSCCLW